MSKVQKESDITCRIGLDDNNVPVSIQWKAENSPDTPFRTSKAMLLSFFDSEFKDTYKIDLGPLIYKWLKWINSCIRRLEV